jgi:hypothetical protein
MLLGLTAFLLHVTNLDSSSAFQCMSNISRITCVQIFQVHQSKCNGHHYVNHMVPLHSSYGVKARHGDGGAPGPIGTRLARLGARLARLGAHSARRWGSAWTPRRRRRHDNYVPLVHYIITVKVEMVTFVSVRHY